MRLSFANPAVLAFCCALAGCAPRKEFSTPVLTAFPTLGFQQVCDEPQGLDTWVIDLLRIDGGNPATVRNRSLCSECVNPSSGVQCTRIQRHCRCSGRRTTSTELDEALSGLRFEQVSPDDSLCIRMIILRRGISDSPAEGPADDCDSNPVCAADADLGDAPVCVLSEAGSASESETPLLLRDWYCDNTTLLGRTRLASCIALGVP